MYQARGQHYPCLNTWPKRECHQYVSHVVLTTASQISKCNHSYQEPARCTGAISSNAPSTAWNTPERFGNANDSVAAFTAVLTAAEAMVDCCGGLWSGKGPRSGIGCDLLTQACQKRSHKREMASSSPPKDHMVALAGLLQASTADASASKQTGASGKTGKQKKKPKTKKQRKKEKQQAKRDQRRHTNLQHLHVSLSLSLSLTLPLPGRDDGGAQESTGAAALTPQDIAAEAPTLPDLLREVQLQTTHDSNGTHSLTAVHAHPPQASSNVGTGASTVLQTAITSGQASWDRTQLPHSMGLTDDGLTVR